LGTTIAETALLAYVSAHINGDDEVREHAHSLAKVLIPYARSERMILGLCPKPSLTWEYSQAHVLLSRIGYLDQSFDEVSD